MSTPKSNFKELRSAVREGDTALARRLIEADHELGRACDLRDGWTALMSAAFWGRVDCVEALIPFSDPNARDIDGQTALMLAAVEGAVGCANALLAVSDMRAESKDGKSAALLAREAEYEEIAELIEAYALAQDERAGLASLTEGRAATRAKARSL